MLEKGVTVLVTRTVCKSVKEGADPTLRVCEGEAWCSMAGNHGTPSKVWS